MKYIFYFLFPSIIFSQDIQSEKFDSIYYDIAVNISSSNPTKAMHLADSLGIYSTNNKQKIKTLMLMADILEKQEKRGLSIIKALEALEVSKKDGDYVWQSRIYGFLSTQYRIIGFIDKGKSFLKKGVEASTHFTNKKQMLKYKAMSNHEMAEYAFEEKDYHKVIEYMQLAMLSYEKEENPQLRSFVTANAEEMLGRSYMLLGENELALSHFIKADLFINKSGSEHSLWAALIYQGLGESFLKNKKIDSAEIYLKKALLISDKGNHNDLKEKVYRGVSEFYKEVNKVDSFMLYSKKYNIVLSENSMQKKLMINTAYNALQKDSNIKTLDKKFYIILPVIFLVVLVYYFYKKRKIAVINDTMQKTHVFQKDRSLDYVLSEKTDFELKEKIKIFEDSNKFLNRNMSLPMLIGELNTNTKYFRQFLKKHKNKDYNSYINELRIHYIINKLRSDEKYSNYKISYLADECGFSSHSKFSASFKNVTGYCPSEFIGNLKIKQ